MRKLLPVLLAVIGIAGGIGAGLFLRPAPEPAQAEAACGPQADIAAAPVPAPVAPAAPPDLDYVKMSNQFVVPLVGNDRVSGMVILTLSLEVTPGLRENVFAREPKLRDQFLQVLFDHANVGGFRGTFTSAGAMDPLRKNLLDVARGVLGPGVTDILITDIARQDV